MMNVDQSDFGTSPDVPADTKTNARCRLSISHPHPALRRACYTACHGRDLCPHAGVALPRISYREDRSQMHFDLLHYCTSMNGNPTTEGCRFHRAPTRMSDAEACTNLQQCLIVDTNKSGNTRDAGCRRLSATAPLPVPAEKCDRECSRPRGISRLPVLHGHGVHFHGLEAGGWCEAHCTSNQASAHVDGPASTRLVTAGRLLASVVPPGHTGPSTSHFSCRRAF